MSRTLITVTLTVLIVLLGSSSFVWAGEEVEGCWDVAPVLVNTENNAFPTVVRLSETDLLLVFRRGTGGLWPLYSLRSTDGGGTWSNLRLVYTNFANNVGPFLLLAADGRLWLAWSSNQSGTFDQYYTWSDDGGLTWDPGIRQIETPEPHSMPVSIVEPSPGNIQIWVDDFYRIESVDNGDTFGLLETFPFNGLFNGRLFVDASGKMWMIGWSGSAVGVASSLDNGDSWSSVTYAASTPYSGGTEPSMYQREDGILCLFWHDPSGVSGGPDEISFTASLNGGISWLPRERMTCTVDRELIFSPTYFEKDGNVHVIFASDRSGTSWDLYMASNPMTITCVDTDGDGFGDPGHPENDCPEDNCPLVYNPYQEDLNFNGVGDACEMVFSPVLAGPASVVQLVTADLDMDNYTDVVFLGETEIGLFIAWGQVDYPSVGDPDSVAAIANADIKVFHLNGDLFPDIVVVSDSWIYGLINNGNRTFEIDSVANATGYRMFAASPEVYGTFPRIALGFIDGDVYPDLLVSPNKLFSGDGTGSFTAEPSLGLSFEAVDVSDIDGDGIDDIVGVNAGSATVYLNDGAGSFTSSGTVDLGLETYDLASVIANVDFNQDGLVDIAAAAAQNTGTDDTTIVTLASGDGLGGMTPVDTIIVLGAAPQMSVSDVNRDSFQDVVISDASTGQLLVRYNDGFGGFDQGDEVLIGTGDDLRFALASADLDRDGQPDFASGSAAGDNLVVALNNLPEIAVLPDEMYVTGYDYVDVMVRNPLGFVISRSLQTVAGSAYWRLLVDENGLLDVRTYDYNLLHGLYRLEARLRPGSGPEAVTSLGIGIDGSQNRVVFTDYRGSEVKGLGSVEQSEGYVFDFEIEASESMRPFNGIPTDNPYPRFDWSRRVVSDPVGTVYRFELDEYHDFSSSLRFEAAGLGEASYRSSSPLGVDSVYYWRYLTSHDGGLSYVDTSLTFAVYRTWGCCFGRVGNVNGEGDYPDEITLSDIILLVDALFISSDCGLLSCVGEADVTQDGGLTPGCENHVTLSDIMYLVDYLFIGGPENVTLPECQ